VNIAVTALDDHLTLKGLIGRGAMGEVHRAWDAALERAVAVKFLRGFDAREAERVLLEARLQARVESPHVVRVHEVGTLGGRPCLVLQLVEGPSLADFGPGCSVEERVELLRQAAEGLHAAHREGLVHRDVKPDNVLVELGGAAPRALVSDFGLARGDEGGLTRSGLPPGTVEYMSPEHLLGTAPADFRSDVYALGASLYALLAGQPPFRRSSEPGGASAETSLLRRILEEAPAPLPGSVPVELRRVVAKAMEKEPGARYGSAHAFAEDLARFQRGEPVQARPAPATERLYRWTRRNRTASRALAVALASLLAALGSALWSSRQAGLEALEATRLGGEAEALQQSMRLAQLMPLHDLRPTLQQVRGAAETVDARRGGRAEGPAAYLKGLAYQLLGDGDAALAWLRRAWELGDRRPGLAYALATAEGERFSREKARLAAIEDLPLRARLVADAAESWRDPALARLATLTGRGDALGRLAVARAALLEDRPEVAVETLAAVAADDPTWLDARALALGAQRLVVQSLADGGRMPEARARAAAAIAVGEETLRVARSGLALRLTVARIHRLWRKLEAPSADALAHSEEGLRLLEEARRLDPGSVELLQVAAEATGERAMVLYDLGRPFREAILEGIAMSRRATEVAPDRASAWRGMADVEANAANLLGNAGEDVSPLLEEAIGAARRALALEPESDDTRLYLALALLLRAHWSQEAGRPGDQDLAEAVEASGRVVAEGRLPVRARLFRSWALMVRARGAALVGRDPATDFEAAWADVREAWRVHPGSERVGTRALDLVNDWGVVALAHGQHEGVPFDEVIGWGRQLAAANPRSAILRGQLGRVLGLSAVMARGAGGPYLPALAEADSLILTLRDSGIAQLVRRTLAELRVALAWVTRLASDAAVAEERARACTRAGPQDLKAQRLLAAAALLRGELAAGPARRRLLELAVAAASLAIDGGQRDAVTLALRGRAREALQPGTGAADLTEARRMDPRLVLLRPPGP
jgi:serine/threonine-protein kinase